MDSIHWAMLLSFIFGACGYIIVRYWIVPISNYKKTKIALTQCLQTYYRKLPKHVQGKALKKAIDNKRLQEIRQLGIKLVEIHDYDVPYWYRLMLLTRKESPTEAGESILKLENLQSIEQIRQCVAAIGQHLKMTLPVS